MSVHPWAYTKGSCTFTMAGSSLERHYQTSRNGHVTLDCTTSDMQWCFFILLHLCCQALLSDSQFSLANSRNRLAIFFVSSFGSNVHGYQLVNIRIQTVIIIVHHKVYNTTMHHIVYITRRHQVALSSSFGWLEWALLPLGVPLSSFGCE
jgi:hypothetical protein